MIISRESNSNVSYLASLKITRFDLSAYLIILATATLLTLPILVRGIPNGDDAAMHYRRTADFIEAMREGSVYPRWLSRSNFGQGSPVMLYYPPLPFYVSAAFYLLVRDPMRALSLSCWFAMALSGLTMYFFSKSVLSSRISLFAALLYMAMPYHIFDLYYRSALSEYWSFAWIPLVFDATNRVASGRHRLAVAYLAVAYSLLLLTHVLISFEVTVLLPIYFLLQSRQVRRGIDLIAGLSTGLLISGIFVVPLLFERSYIRLDRSLRIPFDHFFLFEELGGAMKLRRFLTPTEHSTYFGATLDLVAIGLPILLLAAGILILRKRSLLTPVVSKGLVASLGAVAFVSLLLTTRLSTPIWHAWSQMAFIQFPFRWLTITTPAAVMLAAVALSLISRQDKLILFFATVLVLASVVNVWVSALGVTQASYDRTLLEEGLTDAEVAEYRTVWLDRQKRLDETVKPPVRVSSGEASIVEKDASGSWQSYVASVDIPSSLVLRSYYFPGWVVRVDNRPVEITPSKEGNIQFAIEPGEHIITVTFEDTWPRTAGKFVSAAGLIILVIIIWRSTLSTKKTSVTDRSDDHQNR